MVTRNIIEAVELTKQYGSLKAVDHVSFTVERGEIFGFLGPNGAGKTTTIRMLTGVVKPDFGTAYIKGYDIRKEALMAKQLMGILPEVANAYVDLTAWENLMFLGELYGVPKTLRCERTEILLKKLGLYDDRGRVVRGFSKGMKQRLLLCMALINNPEILFLDEPTSGLDVQSSRLIKEMLMELSQGGVTVFLTTHNMEEANQLCNRVAIINHGEIVVVERPEKLRARVREVEAKWIELAFDRPLEANSLIELPSVLEVKRLGDKLRLRTRDPNELIFQLAEYAKSHKLKFLTLNTLAPSLEDIFLEITKEKRECENAG
ncbi:MAG: ATP-binding cassette domain-containing protein [Candidatus Bathyarchaeia archaeon]